MKVCKICGGTNINSIYNGSIRLGKFGDFSKQNYDVFKCSNCKAKFLSNIIEDISGYYTSSDYRKDVDGSSLVSNFQNVHDQEQLRNLNITGLPLYRNKVVADVGCGGGSFLDSIKGFTKEQVAIEPSSEFREHLKDKGYSTFSYASDALTHYRGQIDVAVSFSVIEHIEEPIAFLKDIYELLKPTGKIIISTPNANDILLNALPDDYEKFFYRKVHLWYFDDSSLKNIMEYVGFRNIKVIPHQRFGLGNFLGWMKDKRPYGDIKYDYLTESIDLNWKLEMEKNLQSDYLFAVAEKI